MFCYLQFCHYKQVSCHCFSDVWAVWRAEVTLRWWWGNVLSVSHDKKHILAAVLGLPTVYSLHYKYNYCRNKFSAICHDLTVVNCNSFESELMSNIPCKCHLACYSLCMTGTHSWHANAGPLLHILCLFQRETTIYWGLKLESKWKDAMSSMWPGWWHQRRACAVWRQVQTASDRHTHTHTLLK